MLSFNQLPEILQVVIASTGTAFAITWIFWAMYVFVMGLYRAKLNGRLGGINYYMGYPVFAVGMIVDIVFNFTLAVLIFLDLPRETLVTSRLKRYMAEGEGWRYEWAKYICDNLLDPFDPTGDHC